MEALRSAVPRFVLAWTAVSALAAGVTGTLHAQAPHEEWRTLELPHFRVHYPAATEAWTRRTASRLEAIRERLTEEIGYAPPQVVDVIVSDPLSRPNGSAVALLGRPRIVLWTTPPQPASLLGRYRDWGELVALHEDAHLVHMLRPSRNRWRRLVSRLQPAGGVGPIARRAPRWVTEGYATLLEGRLTGSGRPNSDLRAAVLRARARVGRLPSYGALGSAADRSWLDPSMAYLAGSAFLEWLEGRERAGGLPGEEAGDGALRDLWARMTARHDRGFEAAFKGVFGEGPAELYGRFTAELAWQALELERRLEGAEADGSLWMDLSWGTGRPAVSPDGARLAAVVRHREEPPRLVVWETAVDEEAEERWLEERDRIAEADPEDVPAVRTAPPFRKRVATLPTFDGRAPRNPRWTPDGDALLFAALGPGPDGVLHGDLYRWHVDSGEVERLTRGADLRSPDPVSPIGTAAADGGPGFAVAVRNRHGFSQLVVVDLAAGTVRELTPPSVEVVWAGPRVAPDGDRLAALRHHEGRWRLVVSELEPGPEGTLDAGPWHELPTPDGATVVDPAWGPDGRTLYAAVGSGGFIDLWAFDPPPASAPAEAASARRLTRTLGATLGPEPTPDGEALFLLSLEHDGLDLRRLELDDGGAARGSPEEAGEPGDLLPEAFAPVVLPTPPEGAEPFTAAEIPPGRPYGLGPLEITPLLGTALAPSGLAAEAGLRLGDPLGRLDAVLLGSAGSSGAMEGGVLAASWQGLPVELSAAAFAVREEPSAQDDPPAAVLGPENAPEPDPGASPDGRFPRALDRDRLGLAVAAEWGRAFTAGGAAVRLGFHGGRVEPAGADSLETGAATLAARLVRVPSRGRRSLPMELSGAVQEGRTDGDGWSRWRIHAGAGVDLGEPSLRLDWRRNGSSGTRFGFDRFQVGGVRRSLLPEDADLARVAVPALPAAILVGEEHESQRLTLEPGFLPAPLFYERHRVWSGGAPKGDWLALAGLELGGRVVAAPLLGLPEARFTLGAAYVLEDPSGLLEDETRFWAALRWHP